MVVGLSGDAGRHGGDIAYLGYAKIKIEVVCNEIAFLYYLCPIF